VNIVNGKQAGLLAIDTSWDILSLALEAVPCSAASSAPAAEPGHGNSYWYFEADAGLRHSELLMDCIDTLLGRAGLKPAELTGIACMGGPGSFTGLRIAYSTAKGLGLALGIPFAAVPSLDCMALPYTYWPGVAVPVIDAKKNAFFCALYRGGKRLSADMDAGPELIAQALAAACGEGEKILLTGPGAEKLYPALAPAFGEGRICLDKRPGGYARELLVIAKDGKISDTINTDWLSGPEYIRKSDAELHFTK
jgi:tRNA threonylcarbamoyladenosine biosynthesis protein TsaB